MAALVSLPFESGRPPGKTTLTVTMPNGQKFEVELALVVVGVADQGITNPLDGMPLFQIASQIVTRVTRKTNG